MFGFFKDKLKNIVSKFSQNVEKEVNEDFDSKHYYDEEIKTDSKQTSQDTSKETKKDKKDKKEIKKEETTKEEKKKVKEEPKEGEETKQEEETKKEAKGEEPKEEIKEEETEEQKDEEKETEAESEEQKPNIKESVKKQFRDDIYKRYNIKTSNDKENELNEDQVTEEESDKDDFDKDLEVLGDNFNNEESKIETEIKVVDKVEEEPEKVEELVEETEDDKEEVEEINEETEDDKEEVEELVEETEDDQKEVEEINEETEDDAEEVEDTSKSQIEPIVNQDDGLNTQIKTLNPEALFDGDDDDSIQNDVPIEEKKGFFERLKDKFIVPKSEEEIVENISINKIKKLDSLEEEKSKQKEEEFKDKVESEIETLDKELHDPKIKEERLAKEKAEKERLEKEKLDKETVEREQLEKEQLEKERIEKEKADNEKQENERLEAEQLEKERIETEKADNETQESERLEAERLEKERIEKEKAEKQLKAEELEKANELEEANEIEDVEEVEVKPEEVKTEITKDISETKKGFFSKIKDVFTTKELDETKFEELFFDLELALLENNVALSVIDKIKLDLKGKLVDQKLNRFQIEEIIQTSLFESIKELFDVPKIDLVNEIKSKSEPYVISFVGINGVGKTTNLAKVANYLKNKGLSVLMVAADTFRVAAIEQIEEHANNLDIKLIKHDYGSDSAAVCFDAIKHAKSKNMDVVLIDTAGRSNANQNLMNELEKVIRISKPDLNLFVGDSLTGNDAVEQAEEFNKVVGIDGVILSKADADEKGGTAISIGWVLKKPILFMGTGQTYDDLEEFSEKTILANLGFN